MFHFRVNPQPPSSGASDDDVKIRVAAATATLTEAHRKALVELTGQRDAERRQMQGEVVEWMGPRVKRALSAIQPILWSPTRTGL